MNQQICGTQRRISSTQPSFRVGFLFNHDEFHQIAHTAPIIPELQRLSPDIEVDILASSVDQLIEAESYLDPDLPLPGRRRLPPGLGARLAEILTGRMAPLRRVSTLKRHREMLGAYDALVVPENTTTLLKSRFGQADVRLIQMPHGAGDRSVCLAPERVRFDLVLLPGQKCADRMIEAGTIRPDGHAIVGYPKFDTIPRTPPPRFFKDDKPVILYNPHFDAGLSSWYDWGEKILNYFARQDRYNLIFAPHVMLFRRKFHGSLEQRRIRIRRHLAERFGFAPNIRIDVGSEHSVDMTYTRSADIYLGDVSSQIYEFLIEPRPAIFLNAHGADWRGDPNYAHWALGPVLDDPDQLGATLDSVEMWRAEYDAPQAEAFARTFSLDPDRSSSERAAAAIVEFLRRDAQPQAPAS